MKVLVFLLCFSLIVHGGISAQLLQSSSGARNIARIHKDTIVVISGSTYSYTVDTPEDKGLVSTGINAAELLSQWHSLKENSGTIIVKGKNGEKKEEDVETGDRLMITSNKTVKSFYIKVEQMALPGQLVLNQQELTVNAKTNLVLSFTAGQRTPDATIRIRIPSGITVNMKNTTVNVIGRGNVPLDQFSSQSIGRTGNRYSYQKVGEVQLMKAKDGGTWIQFDHLDLRPSNGVDVQITIYGVQIKHNGNYFFSAQYSTTSPMVLTSAGTGPETAKLRVESEIRNLQREIHRSITYSDAPDSYTRVMLKFPDVVKPASIRVWQSMDGGKTWKVVTGGNDLFNGLVFTYVMDDQSAYCSWGGLIPGKWYCFRLQVKDGPHKGYSNTVRYYSGKMNSKQFGIEGKEGIDYTYRINAAIDSIHRMGGGTLLFGPGIYSVRTIHLKSNVYLYLEKGSVIKALRGADAPESTWFSDKKYRSGLSPTDRGPYDDPENYMTKQDVGHHYFHNAMFFGERLDNIKIIGRGLITGNGNLVTGDRVMNNAPDNRADKMFSLKLCTNVEIGGLSTEDDLWYDPQKDEPYYIQKNGKKRYDLDNMLQIDRGGHFVLLATGTDQLNVHDTYFGKNNTSNVRDIYDFMACNEVTVTNIYSKVSSDDIIKPGSDCSLGFTRPARDYKVRNVIGDTNCNLFQIGSETADDIKDICVDNIYVLGANKAGFSISTNDGGHIENIHLNCGHTGSLHSRSIMFRTTTPFFISISNRGRIIGAEVGRYAFTDHGEKHNELLVKNVNIGQVKNITINGIDIVEVYGGSSFGGQRWKAFNDSQRRATPIIAGYRLPDNSEVEGGLDFRLPNGLHTGYIETISFEDVNLLVKGGNPLTDTSKVPPELGVGQYNVSNLKVQPSYGIWARHVRDLSIKNSRFSYEKRDNRYAIYLDDVFGATIDSCQMVRSADNPVLIRYKDSKEIVLKTILYYNDKWGKEPEMMTVDR